MSYLNHIPHLEDENFPGLWSIDVARVADIDNYPDAYDGIAVSEVTFHAGRGWVRWAATYNTSRFDIRSTDTREGIVKNQSLPFVIPRHAAAITNMLQKAERDEFIIKVKDHNGQEYIWGSIQKPVRFQFDQSTGGGSNRNEYSCSFYSEASENLMIYPANFSISPVLPGALPVVIRRGSMDGPVLAVAPAGSTVVISSPYSFGFQLSIS